MWGRQYTVPWMQYDDFSSEHQMISMRMIFFLKFQQP